MLPVFMFGGLFSDEGKLLREIVETALHNMKKVPLEVATFPVGLNEAVRDFESKCGSSIGSQNIHIVGIVGMGGSGKSTLAKELYNRKCSSVTRSSFLFNIRDAKNSLHKLQEKLLKDLGIQHQAFDNIDQGKEMLSTYLRSMAVLIVLDDVDDGDEMDALLPDAMRHNLGRGSFILITTRDVDVLTSWGISSIYPMKKLEPSNAEKLFCRHAFLHPYSQPGVDHLLHNYPNFQDLIQRFVKACDGLPLSLKVLGAMVNSKNKVYWESQLQKLSKILPGKIAECLKLSYDALDREVRQMFLDVACFFIGEEKSLVVAIWDGSEWIGHVGWETLVNKCLVGLNEDGKIEMHDHLRDLGREIALDVSPSRIWEEKQMSIQEGRTLIRGIVPKGFTPSEHFMENIVERPPSRELQLLVVYGNGFRQGFAALSKHLVWLRWYDFTKTNLPSWLSLKNLRVLELKGAKNLKELWQENVQPPLQLRELIIEITSTRFRSLPRSIGRLRLLKKIVLNGYDCGMWSLPKEFCHLESLEILELICFPMLSSLPDDFGKLMKLRSLRIINCPKLKELPHLNTQGSLRELELRNTGLRELPNYTSQLWKLETLKIWSCSVTSLPESIGALPCLTSLKISSDSLISLPESLGQLPCLTSLEIISDSLISLPESLGQLPCLTSLRILGRNLTSLPKSLGALPCLTSLEISGASLTSLPESLGALPCLTSLHIRGDSLTSLPESLGALPCLASLKIEGFSLTSLPESLGALPCLASLKIEGFSLTSLPESLAALPCLASLYIRGDSLTSLPESLEALSRLTSRTIELHEKWESAELRRLSNLQSWLFAEPQSSE